VIESLRGVIESCSADSAVLRLGGVSIRLGVTGETVRSLHPGDAAELFTHLYMREDVLALYGFATLEERSLFEELMGVTGVGPRAALGFLSSFTPSGLRDAIEQEDITRLTRVPGVGRKTALRVVLELKGKLTRVGGLSPTAAHSSKDQELLNVLSGLGYTAAEAAEALRHGSEAAATGTDEDRLRAALRYFAGR
jgi:Holliday junction DNA helicase RuvA